MNTKVNCADGNSHGPIDPYLVATFSNLLTEADVLPPVVLDPELVERMRIYDRRVHDMSTSEDLSFLVNHFLGIGLKHAEAERDALTGDLF